MKTAHEQGTVERVTEAAGERAKSCVDAGVSALNAVSGRAHEIGQQADGYVRENAWMAIGAAAGAGLLVGLLLGGRR
jgi:ElaB/YqjD/DUF883 family membrane-anchored ribosome-binding protein